jgi:integrase
MGNQAAFTGKLTALRVAREKRPGTYGDGQNLYLQVTAAGPNAKPAKSWIFRYRASERDAATGELLRDASGKVRGRTRELGLGSTSSVTLARARELAHAQRELRQEGGDPIEARRAAVRKAAITAAKTMTFRECAERYVEAHSAKWKNAKHRQQWSATLAAYAFPLIGDLPVREIDNAAVVKVLEPIWSNRTETAGRLRGRIECVLDWARVRGYREGDNPAQWRGFLSTQFPKTSEVRKVEHHSALAYAEIPAFVTLLREQEGIAARALEFAIFTAGRTGEVLGARWDEIDRAERMWTIPGSRMKAKKDHRVPLSAPALAIVDAMRGADRDFIFPGRKAGAPLSGMALLMTLRRMRRGDLTAHGFRSSFRVWAAECTTFPAIFAEMALAHTVSDKVVAAYLRTDLLEKRRAIMSDWSALCDRPAGPADVVSLHSRSAA